MKYLLGTGLFVLFSWTLAAQDIIVREASPIGAMMEAFKSQNRSGLTIPGWRIQLLATTDREKVEFEKIKFSTKYPDIRVDWVHSKPYYKLQAGAYASRMETYRMLHRIKEDFPGAYPAADQLKPEELLEQ